MKVPLEKPGSPEELIHFGKKGMRWGVRKKPETSKSETTGWSKKKSTRVESRAKGHDVQAHIAQKQIDEIRSNPSKWKFIQRGREDHAQKLEHYRDIHVKAAKDLRAGHLTDHQKKVIIGASAVAVALAAYGTYKTVDSGTATQLLNRNTAFKTNDLLSRKMGVDGIMKDVVKPINPHYGNMGTKNNCRRATMAYEMRRRGMDVRATRSHAGTGQTVAGMLNATNPESKLHTGRIGTVIELLKEGIPEEGQGPKGPLQRALASGGQGKERIDFGRSFISGKEGMTLRPLAQTPSERTHRIFESIARHGEGARGELGVSWTSGGAHSMAWEVIGGRPHIFDTQTGTSYDVVNFTQAMGSIVREAGITRLDNVELNQNFLKKWVTNA